MPSKFGPSIPSRDRENRNQTTLRFQPPRETIPFSADCSESHLVGFFLVIFFLPRPGWVPEGPFFPFPPKLTFFAGILVGIKNTVLDVVLAKRKAKATSGNPTTEK